MGQKEVIQALKNLGGSAFLRDLEVEYYNLCYPPQYYGEDYAGTRNYDKYAIINQYLTTLKRNRQIQLTKVPKPDEEYKEELQKRQIEQGNKAGALRNKIKVTLIT